ncbi:MAG TPA: ATP-binding protein [Fibrobacteria bacterium]|nr:ATP-binding protein [Fibrobacteria bacterium]
MSGNPDELNDSARQSGIPGGSATFVVLVYAGVSLIWILGSDHLVFTRVQLVSRESFSILKGIGFVAVTSLLLLFLIRRLLRQVEAAQASVVDARAKEAARRELDARERRLEGLGRIAAGVAHDLNNVLTPMRLAMDRIREQPAGTDTPARVESAIAFIERGREMVRGLLEFGEGRGGIAFQVEPVVREAVSDFSEGFPDGLVVEVLCEPGLEVVSDPRELHRAVTNLLVNAKQSSLGSPRIQVETLGRRAPSGPQVEISVEDAGAGIPPELRARVLEPYFTTRSKSGGTGIGLANVNEFCRNWGGCVEVADSPRLGGARLAIRLPARTVEPSDTPSAASQGECLLVVEDEAAIRTFLQEWLEASGFQVVAATDIEDVRKVLRSRRPPLRGVLMDWWIQGSRPEQVLGMVRGHTPGVPCVVMSGLEVPRTDLDRLGIERFLQKPFSSRDLMESLVQTGIVPGQVRAEGFQRGFLDDMSEE